MQRAGQSAGASAPYAEEQSDRAENTLAKQDEVRVNPRATPIQLADVKMISVSKLRFDPKNARSHPDRNIASIVSSLEKFGQHRAAVVQKQGMIVRIGNGMLTAARKLGWKKLACFVVDESDVEATARAIADNRTAELAEWDDVLLADILGDLRSSDIDHLVTGFDDNEIDGLIARAQPIPEEDEVPEKPKKPKTKLGDLWLLGEHRLLCGDATKKEDVERVLDGEVPILMVTDPPYGVNYDPNWRVEAASTGNIMYGATRVGKVDNDDRADWSEAWSLFPGDVIYNWTASGGLSVETGMVLIKSGFEIRNQVVWRKPHLVISRGHYHSQHELCWYAVRKGKKAHWVGDRSQTSVWDIPQVYDDSDKQHSTQKPVECMFRAIRNHKGDVYDPFVGTGTTLVAAEKLGRRCFAIELDPGWCDVVVKRWENLTGGKAKRG